MDLEHEGRLLQSTEGASAAVTDEGAAVAVVITI